MGKIFVFYLLMLNISWSYQDDNHPENDSPIKISMKGCSEDVAAKFLYFIHSEVTLTAIPPPFTETFDLHIKRTVWSIVSVTDGEIEMNTAGPLVLKIPPLTFKKTGLKKVNIFVTYTNKFLGEGAPENYIQHTCFISIDKRPIYFYIKTPRLKVMPCYRPFEVKLGISKAVRHEYIARIKCDYQADICKERILENYKTTYTSLPCDKIVKFTASAIHYKTKKLFQITFALQTSKEATSDLELKCISNCGLKIAQGKPFELHLYENPPTNSQTKWTIKVKDNMIDPSNFVNEQNPNVLLMTDPQFQKSSYVVIEAKKNSSVIMYAAEMNELPSKGSCVVTPNNGTSLTVYEIMCFGISDPDPLKFSLYQLIGSKRILLISALIPYFQDIVLSSDSILVVINDGFAEISSDPVKINFSKIQGPTLEHMIGLNDLDAEIILQKLIAFTLQNPNISENTKIEILKKMAKLEFYNSHVQEQGVELLSILISDINSTVNANIFFGLSYTLEKLMEQILYLSTIQIEQEDEESKPNFTDVLITVFGVISSLRDPLIQNILYPSDLTHIRYRKVKKGVNLFIKALEDFIEFVAIQNTNCNKSFEKIWVNVVTVRCLDLFNTTIQDPSKKMKVIFNSEFVQHHCQSGGVTIGVVCLIEEIMWWNEEFEQITPSISIALWNATTKARLDSLHKPFDVYLQATNKIKPEVHVLNMKPLPVGGMLNEMDDSVTLLVFLFERNVGTMSFTFNKYENLKVLVTQDMRPSFEMLSKTTTLKAETLTFQVKRNQKLNIAYLSILPTKNVTSSINITVQISHLVCSVWNKERMNSSFCTAQLENNTIHCQCSHLSFIAASFFMAPHYVNNLLEEPLSVVLQKNYSLLVFPSVIALLFLLIFLLMIYQQKYKNIEQSIEILQDNFPGDEIPYLISVHSGKIFSRANTAHVAIRLFGTKAVSRIHILEKRIGKVLLPSVDDWFIIFTKEPLGDVNSVEIWHDDFGHNPEWFCIKIIIYDLKNSEYYFPIKKWFSIFDIMNHLTSHKFNINTAPVSTNNCTIARKDFYRHLREQHRHITIFTRHPRSAFTVVEKILLYLTFFSIHMMINIMFFGIHSRSPIIVSRSQMTVFMVALESTIITIFLSNLLMIFFKKSKEHCFQGEVLSPNYKLLTKKSDSTFHKMLINLYAPKMFMSLRLNQESHPINIWTIFSWFTSFAIFFACISVVSLFILDFGGHKTFHWIANFILALFQQFFIEPIFIFVSVFITSVICKMTFLEKIKTYKIQRDETWRKSKKMITEVHLSLLQQRIKAFYTKNFMKFKEEFYERKLRRMRHLKVKMEFSTLAIFFIILGFLVFSLSIHEKNYIIYNLKSFIEYQTKASEYNIHDVISHDRLADYLIEKLIPALHNLDWYNGKRLPLEWMDTKVPKNSQRRETVQKGFTKDYMSKIIGKPRIAQRRVKPDYYYGVSSFWDSLFNRSYSRLNMFSEDTRSYLPGWKHYDSDAEEIWNHTIYNFYPSRLYTGLHIGGSREIYKIKDGYVILLSTFGGESSKRIVDLSLDNFFNNFTRIIYIEFYLMSINSNMLAQVLLSIEHFCNGVYIPKLQLEAITMDATVPSISVLLTMCCLSVIGVVFMILSMRKILRFDITQSMKSIYSINSTLIAVLTLCSILFFIMRWTTLNLSTDEYVESYVSDYISFLIPTEMDFKFQVAIGILCCLISLQFTKFKPDTLREDSTIVSTFFHKSTVFLLFVLYTVVIIAVFLSSDMWIDYQQTFCFDQDFSLQDHTNTKKINRIFNLTWISIMVMGYIFVGVLVAMNIKKHRERFRLDTTYHQLFTQTKKSRTFGRSVRNNSLTFRRHLLQMKLSHLLNKSK